MRTSACIGFAFACSPKDFHEAGKKKPRILWKKTPQYFISERRNSAATKVAPFSNFENDGRVKRLFRSPRVCPQTEPNNRLNWREGVPVTVGARVCAVWVFHTEPRAAPRLTAAAAHGELEERESCVQCIYSCWFQTIWPHCKSLFFCWWIFIVFPCRSTATYVICSWMQLCLRGVGFQLGRKINLLKWPCFSASLSRFFFSLFGSCVWFVQVSAQVMDGLPF